MEGPSPTVEEYVAYRKKHLRDLADEVEYVFVGQGNANAYLCSDVPNVEI